MIRKMSGIDRKLILIILVLMAVTVLATACSLSVAGATLERQSKRRWGLSESQISEIKQLVDRYRRGEIGPADFERIMLSKFREWDIVPPPSAFALDIEIFYTAKSVLSSVNVTLVIILLLVYIDVYRKTRAQFALGLIIFSLILLFYTLSSNPFMQMLFGFKAFGLGPFAMLPDLFTFAALIILLYLSLK